MASPLSNSTHSFPERLGVDLLLANPFLGQLLAKINKIPHKDLHLSSWGLDTYYNFSIYYSPTAESNKLYSSLKAQLLHLLLEHPLQAVDYDDPLCFQLVAELTIAQFLSLEDQSPGLKALSEIIKTTSSPTQLPNLYQYLVQQKKRLLPQLPAHYRQALQQQIDTFQLQSYTQQEQALIRSKLRHLLRQHWKSHEQEAHLTYGRQLVEQLQRPLTPIPKAINWKQQIRQFALRSRGSRRQSSLRRPSKRYGTWPGSRRKRQQHLIIAIDTSASIRPIDLQRFFQQIHQIWKAGAQLTIIECDDRVRQHYPYRGQAPAQVKGRGDTRFAPALEFAQQHFSFDGLLYFTDGYGPVFSLEVSYPLLWIISPDGLSDTDHHSNNFPGRFVKMT